MLHFQPANQTIRDSKKPQIKITEGEVVNQIQEYLDTQKKQDCFSGCVLIAKDGKPLFTTSAGFASKRFNALNNVDTKFNLGSINKSFTAVAILQLVESGKINIDDPIIKYLDIFPAEIASKVKIRHLLMMNSGWGDYWNNPYYLQHQNELRGVSEYMQFIKDIPLDFEPGTQNQHSNTGFEVAGAIIEKVSGMDYFEYIRKRIYQPASMLNSDSFDRDSDIPNLATGYTKMHSLDSLKTNWFWNNTYILSPRGTPSGGGYSTVGDMLKYDNAFRSGKLVGKAYIDFMSNGMQGNIGDVYVPQKTLRSAGAAPGISAFYARDNKTGYTIIILCNIDPPGAMEIGNEVIRLLGL